MADKITYEPNVYEPSEWLDSNNRPLACDEKLEAMRENIAEIGDVIREAFEDAVLMGANEMQFRETLKRLIDHLETPYAKK